MLLRHTLLASALASAFITPAFAQPVRPDAGTTLQQQSTQPAPQASPARPNTTLPSGFTPKPRADALGSGAIKVARFKFTGNSQIDGDTLAALIADAMGKDLTLAQLNALADRVQAHYRTQGYFLAQAYLPRQDITEGTIEITVLEGHIGTARATSSGGGLRQSTAQGVLNAHLPAGRVITESALERPLLLLSDMPNTRVQSSIGPGAGVGSADLAVNVAPHTGYAGEGLLSRATGGLLTGNADIDNWGNRFTGEWRLGAGLNVNNATGFGDLFSLRAQVSLDNSKTNFGRLAWQVPVGPYGTKVGVSYSVLNYSLIKDFAPRGADGDGAIASGFISHPIIRSRNANLNLSAGYDSKELEDRSTTPFNVETRRIKSTRIAASGDVRDSLLGGGLGTFSLAHTQGRLGIEQPGPLAFDIGAGGPNTSGGFSKTNLDLQRLQTLTRNLSLYLNVNAQFASKNLASAEKMSLGGVSGVRAYPSGEASGDEGYVGTLEARFAPGGWRVAGAAIVLNAFYDHGRVKVNKIALPAVTRNERELTGAGVGVNIAKDGDFLLRASAAWRVKREAPTSDADRSPRMWLQAIKWF